MVGVVVDDDHALARASTSKRRRTPRKRAAPRRSRERNRQLATDGDRRERVENVDRAGNAQFARVPSAAPPAIDVESSGRRRSACWLLARRPADAEGDRARAQSCEASDADSALSTPTTAAPSAGSFEKLRERATS